MFKHILVPLDESERAEQVLPVAIRLARASGGTITLLEVIPPPTEFGPYWGEPPLLVQRAIDTDLISAAGYLAQLARREIFTGVETETKTVCGPPASTICATAEEQEIDLIVMSSHGRTGLKRWALGSVAQKVARHSSVPVLVLREGCLEKLEPRTQAAPPLRALVALDGSQFAEAVITPAAELVAALAAPARGALHLVRIVNVSSIHSEADRDVREQAIQEATIYLCTVVDEMGYGLAEKLGLEVTWSVVASDDVADTFIDMAEHGEDTTERCNLIALTTHGRGGLQRWMMGSIAERVLEGAHLPVLIVRPQEQQKTDLLGKEKSTL